MSVGIITGTGFGDGELVAGWRTERIQTYHGSVDVHLGSLGGTDIAYIQRHGLGSAVAPHRVNYQANAEALEMLGCAQVIATNAVGSLLPDLGPGAVAVPSQFLDFTHGRAVTLFDREGDDVTHIDMTEPYCPDLRAAIVAAAGRAGVECRDGLTYVCTQGPRFETAAEIRMFAALGGHIVGMTGVPEVVFAREAGLCYASLCIVSNLAAGIAEGPITADEVCTTVAASRERVWQLIAAVVSGVDAQAQCPCCLVPWEQ